MAMMANGSSHCEDPTFSCSTSLPLSVELSSLILLGVGRDFPMLYLKLFRPGARSSMRLEQKSWTAIPLSRRSDPFGNRTCVLAVLPRLSMLCVVVNMTKFNVWWMLGRINSLSQASSFNLEDSLVQLQRPMKPIWVSPAAHLGEDLLGNMNELDFHPVICLSASKYLGDHASLDRAGGFTYVQGAGDDHEGWSMGLTPKLFWENRLQLLSADRSEIESLIDQIVSSSQDVTFSDPKRIELFQVRTTKLVIHFPSDVNENLSSEDDGLAVIISGCDSVKLIHKKCKLDASVALLGNSRTIKNLSKVLLSVLPDCMQMMKENKTVRLTAIGPKLAESKELLVAIALCLLVNVFDDQGKRREGPPKQIEKADIRDRLHWIIEASQGTINPPRSILKKVNNFLIS